MDNKSVNNAFYNILSNFIKIAVVSIVTFSITGILVRELGDELYGVVPLFTSINRYIGLVTTIFAASVGRFVSLSFFKERIDDANKYYSSSFFGLLLIAFIAFFLLYGFSFFIDVFFQFPREALNEVKFFFMLSASALLISSIVAPFNVAAFIRHSFYLTDIVSIISKLVQIVVLLFLLGHITLIWFGFSLLGSALVTLILTYFISTRLLPNLSVKLRNFSKVHLKEMSGMGINSLFNSLGILFYTSSDIIIINVLLGSVKSGHYGIAVQCGMIVTLVGGSITRLLAPVLIQLIAKGNRGKIIDCINRYTRLITVFSALPFIVFMGFSEAIFGFWLGEGFEHLFLINIIVVFNQLLHQTTSLTFTYFNMRNKLRTPAIVTFFTGLCNIILSVTLVKYTELGIYGVALGTFISIFFKTVIFNVVYAARLLEISSFIIWKSVLKGLYWPLIFGFIVYVFFNFISLDSILSLAIYIIASTIIFMIGALYLPLTFEDRMLLYRILKLDSLKNKLLTK